MTIWIFKSTVVVILFLASLSVVSGQQTADQKQPIGDSEKQLIQNIFEEIARTDQLYRKKLSVGTLDENILARIDSVYEADGIEAAMAYEASLNLSLPESIKDSLWGLQAAIDLQNHLTLRGLWDVYGYIPKTVVEEKQYVQHLLLLHPPKDWDVRTYQKEYAELLLIEVRAGRMEAKHYASFYDNMSAKILREPQLYGTNQQFDRASNRILPPIIEDLAKANAARAEIGLPELKEGEYRLNAVKSKK
ncbi:MAG: hypothetical protein AAF849_23765 [Bacteroidota bacterium]